jgi:hypothetical protein
MKINIKIAYIGLLWLVVGFLCAQLSTYFFNYYISDLVYPSSKFVDTKLHSKYLSMLTIFFIFNVSDLLFIFLGTFILSFKSGKNVFLFILFAIGALGVSFYYTTWAITEYCKLYDPLPSWVVSWFIQEIVFLIFALSVAWAGILCGNRYRKI